MMKRLVFIVVALLLISLLLATVVSAQTGSGFDLRKNVIGAGGGKMSGSGFVLTGTVGQTAAGPTIYSVNRANQGFWYMAPFQSRIYVPTLMKKH